MTSAQILFLVAKVVLSCGAVAVLMALGMWADWREAAQRRASTVETSGGLCMPWWLARMLVLGPTLLLAGAVGVTMWWPTRSAQVIPSVASALHGATFVGWVSLILFGNFFRKHGTVGVVDALIARPDPRRYFYGGIALHALFLFAIPFFPAAWLEPEGTFMDYPLAHFAVATGIAGWLFAVVVLAAGAYAALQVERGARIELSLAGIPNAVSAVLQPVRSSNTSSSAVSKVRVAFATGALFCAAALCFAIIPFGDKVCLIDVNRSGGIDVSELFRWAGTAEQNGRCARGQVGMALVVADMRSGLVYILALMLVGFTASASMAPGRNSTFGVGAVHLRPATVLAIAAIAVSVLGMSMVTASADLSQMVQWQGSHAWGVFVQPLGCLTCFLVMLVAIRPWARSDGTTHAGFVSGQFRELRGVEYGVALMGQYATFVLMVALMATVFFGGYRLPFLEPSGIRVQVAGHVWLQLPLQHWAVTVLQGGALVAKMVALALAHRWLQRWWLQGGSGIFSGWTSGKLLLVALANLLLTSASLLAYEGASPPLASTTALVGDLTELAIVVAMLGGVLRGGLWLLDPSTHAPYPAPSGPSGGDDEDESTTAVAEQAA